jgi:hypothetical protein
MRDHWFDERGNFQPDAVRDIEVGGRVLYNSSLENGPARPEGEPGVRYMSDKDIARIHVAREAHVAQQVAEAKAQLREAEEVKRQAREEFRETRSPEAEGLSFLDHAEIDETVARTAYYAALDEKEMEAGLWATDTWAR